MSTWQPAAPEPGPRRIRDSLSRVAHSLGMAAPDALGAVFGRWSEVVGDTVAAHTRPVSLTRGTLTVAVDQPAWATQLRYLEADLLVRLEAVAGPGVVAHIEVRVRPS